MHHSVTSCSMATMADPDLVARIEEILADPPRMSEAVWDLLAEAADVIRGQNTRIAQYRQRAWTAEAR